MRDIYKRSEWWYGWRGVITWLGLCAAYALASLVFYIVLWGWAW